MAERKREFLVLVVAAALCVMVVSCLTECVQKAFQNGTAFFVRKFGDLHRHPANTEVSEAGAVPFSNGVVSAVRDDFICNA